MASAVEAAAAIARRASTELEDCTVDICPIETSPYKYRPSLAGNSIFTAIFALCAIGYAVQGFHSKRFVGFAIAMFLGCVSETIGYIGRIMMWINPWAGNPFMMQIACLTFAPAFLAAGIYFTLSRIVVSFGRDNSRLRPLWYPRIFIPCDVLSLLFQAIGGGIAAAAETREGSDLGANIMIVGLVLQVVTLTAFIALVTDFAIRTWRRIQAVGDSALDARYAALRKSTMFRAFLVGLALATLLIYIRCVYRIAELSDGWDGPLMSDEGLFIGLEGILIAASVVILVVLSPCYCFKEGYDKDVSHEMKNGKKNGDYDYDANKVSDGSGTSLPLSSSV